MKQKPLKKPLKIGFDYQQRWHNLPLGAHDYIYHATETECIAIAQRLELSKINQLTGEIELIRQNSQIFTLNMKVGIDYQQVSMISCEEMQAQFNFDARIDLHYQSPNAKNNKEILLDVNEAEIFDTETLPLVEYLVQELSLNLPFSPEHADNSHVIAENSV